MVFVGRDNSAVQSLSSDLYVLTATILPTAQAVVLVAALSLLPLSQWVYQPYKQFNRVAVLSLVVVWGTAYTGLYFFVSGSNVLCWACIHGFFCSGQWHSVQRSSARFCAWTRDAKFRISAQWRLLREFHMQ